MDRITQDMRFRQSLMQYAEKHGVTKASRRYDKSPSYVYFWRKRWDGSMESLREKSRRPHHHPNQHSEAELIFGVVAENTAPSQTKILPV